MGRTRPSPHPQAPTAQLPVVSFKIVEDEKSAPPSGVHDVQARSYGYNDFSDFERPDHYIRHIEPLESDLARQVEYDMDEQDKEWLDTLNIDRKKEHLDKVTYETFEIIMDRLEKEWFDLTKNIPKADFAMPSEDSTCAICDDSEGENANAIVFCDGCNLAVHQDCYGVPYIPEGQWLCRKCTVSPENPPSCVLCPNEGGAFKQTVTGEWCHLLCAIWIPETRVANEVFMEPVTGVDKISKQRWKLRCSICDVREGACIQCAKTSCFLAFHPTCARKEKLLSPMKTMQGAEPAILTCFCERHLSREQQEAREKALAAEGSDENTDDPSKSSKSARAYAKSYKSGPPLIPAIIVDRIGHYIGKINIRKKQDFLHMTCRYWSLKREARRGAPLLKRLHLEPWTATSTQPQSDEDKALKLDILRELQQNLENARSIVELTRKREVKKRKQADIIRNLLTNSMFPYESKMRLVFENIMQLDRNDYFKNPVNKTAVAPDYFEIVKEPMCWSIIDTRLDKHQYWDLSRFKNDVQLVLSNAMLYNDAKTPIHKTALRIQTSLPEHFSELEQLALNHYSQTSIPELSTFYPNAPIIGDLEPPLDVLELLTTTEAIDNNLRIVLSSDPISSLFKSELAIEKPPPPLPTPPVVSAPIAQKKKKKTKAERKADQDAYTIRRREKRAAEKAARLAESSAEGAASSSGAVSEGGTIITRRALAAEAEATSSASEASGAEASSTGSVSAGPGKTSKPRRAPLNALPSQPEFMENVDSKNSFRYFNAGWILPAQQKRHGRAPPVERPVLPLPRRRAKTVQGGADRATSSLSVFSTAEVDNETLQDTSGGDGPSGQAEKVPEAPEDPTSTDVEQSAAVETEAAPAQSVPATAESDNSHVPVPMEVTAGDDRPPEVPVEPEDEQEPPPSADVSLEQDPEMTTDEQEPPPSADISMEQEDSMDVDLPVADTELPRTIRRENGRVIIEELDTPATRRVKSLRRKTERAKEKQAAIEQTSGPGLAGTLTAGSSLTSLTSIAESKSKTSLQEVGADTPKNPAREPPKGKTGKGKKGKGKGRQAAPATDEPEPGLVQLADGEMLPGGTLVWAKTGPYPWWPAVIWEEDDPSVPGNIRRMLKEQRSKYRGKIYHIVQFFDKGKTWSCQPLDKLRMLGEDAALDEDLLAPSSKRQRWRNNNRTLCREAYREAKSEMETEGDGDEGGAVEEEAEGEDDDGDNDDGGDEEQLEYEDKEAGAEEEEAKEGATDADGDGDTEPEE